MTNDADTPATALYAATGDILKEHPGVALSNQADACLSRTWIVLLHGRVHGALAAASGVGTPGVSEPRWRRNHRWCRNPRRCRCLPTDRRRRRDDRLRRTNPQSADVVWMPRVGVPAVVWRWDGGRLAGRGDSPRARGELV